LPCLAIWAWLPIVFVQPLLTLLAAAVGASIASLVLALSAIQVAGALALFGLTYRRFRLPGYLTFCYPLAVLMGAGLALRSMAHAIRGGSTWKGRTLMKPKIRLV
jgi:hypothetical protein